MASLARHHRDGWTASVDLHASIFMLTLGEDTIIFPAWKQTMTAKELDEMNDKFEDIEHEQFGENGFEDAVKQISAIEKSLGLADISQFTAPPPPKVSGA